MLRLHGHLVAGATVRVGTGAAFDHERLRFTLGKETWNAWCDVFGPRIHDETRILLIIVGKTKIAGTVRARIRLRLAQRALDVVVVQEPLNGMEGLLESSRFRVVAFVDLDLHYCCRATAIIGGVEMHAGWFVGSSQYCGRCSSQTGKSGEEDEFLTSGQCVKSKRAEDEGR